MDSKEANMHVDYVNDDIEEFKDVIDVQMSGHYIIVETESYTTLIVMENVKNVTFMDKSLME